MKQLLVGAAREVITPALGVMLRGYTPRRPALSVHDDLYVTVFAFESAGTQALLLSADLCVLEDPDGAIRKCVADATDVPADNIVISCTHTHSGPCTDEGPYLYDTFIPKAIEAAKAALSSRRPAQMGVGKTESDVSINRREIREDGTVALGQNPYGSRDPVMTVVSFRGLDGTPIGNILHFGCHNTASGKNDEITRDWCGVAVDRLQEVSGGITGFFNGCGGDCGPRLSNGKTTGNLQLALELGAKAAEDAVRAWQSIRVWENVPLKVLRGDVALPLLDIGTEEQVMAQVAAMGDPDLLVRTERTSYQNLLERAEYLRNGNIPPKAEVLSFTALSLGELAMMPIPFEPFSIITLRIRDASPFSHTLCLGYSNGSLSYFPSMDQLIRGGYEVRLFRTMNIVPFADDAEQHLVTGCLRLLRLLHQQ